MKVRRPDTHAAQGSPHQPGQAYTHTGHEPSMERRGAARVHRAHLAAWFVVAPMLLAISTVLLTAAACSREVRHRVLTFFYDGVPPLDGGMAEPGAAPSGDSEVITVGAPGSETERPRFYNHPAFWRNLCAECHEGSGGGLLKTVREGLCETCHPDNPPTKKFVHGPVAVNGCLACHRYHRSRYPKVLVTDAQSLCYLCHVNEELVLDKHHETIEEKRCIDCHDAHGGDDRFFLLPGVAEEEVAEADSS